MNEIINFLKKRLKSNNNIYDKINDLICIIENKKNWLDEILIEELEKINKKELSNKENQMKEIIINDIKEILNKKNYIKKINYENLIIYTYTNKIDIYSSCFNENILKQIQNILKNEDEIKILPPIILFWDEKKNKKKIFTNNSKFNEKDTINLILSLKSHKLCIPFSKKYNPTTKI